MAIEFTDEQLKVINTHGRNVLVSAAAGSGKTAVLVERIIRMITRKENPLQIDRLLVVTFTEKAAGEMRDRIGKAIEKELKESPDNEHLQAQAALLYKAQISTIHSFCLNIIRNNFNKIGLDPSFRIADEAELKLMEEDVLSDLLESEYEKADSRFIETVNYFIKGVSDENLRECILKLYAFSQGYPWPKEWLDSCAAPYLVTNVVQFNQVEMIKNLLEYINSKTKDLIGRIEGLRKLVNGPNGPVKYNETIDSDIAVLNQILSCSTYDEYVECFKDLSFARIATVSKDCDQEAVKMFKEARDNYKIEVTGNKAGSLKQLLGQPAKNEVKRIETMKPIVLEVVRLTEEYSKRFLELRRSKGIISFSDMEHYALDILYETEGREHFPGKVAEEYRESFDEILMDEYQDCNRVQELLMEAVCGEKDGRHNRFMVGDVKQSIYKFRLANPDLFLDKYNCYENDDLNSQRNLTNERIDLHRNFRSRESVINSVNDLFGQIMCKELGGIDYDDDAVLIPGAKYPDNESSTELLLVAQNNDSNSNFTKGEQEGFLIAQRIKELISQGKVTTDSETKKLRPVEYKDIVILLRSMTDVAEGIKSAFSKVGIPVHLTLNSGFYQTNEVQEVLQLLKVVDNPRQDIPLYGTLTSFFGGFSDDEIAKIKIKTPGKRTLYERLQSLSEDDLKVRRFLEYIKNLRKKAVYTPIHRFISEIAEETGYLNHLAAMPGGSIRKSNIMMLISKAAAFESTSYKGIFHFNRFISKLQKMNHDEGGADSIDENANVVRVMTIHKSKGLEFPIVFLSGIHKQFNFSDTNGKMVIDMKHGIGLSYVDVEKRIKSDTMYKKAANLNIKNDVLGEELRVLYVAMTRAKEKMIITGVIKEDEIEKYTDQADDTVTFSELLGAKSYLDYLKPMKKDAVVFSISDISFLAGLEADKSFGKKEKLLTDIADGTEDKEPRNIIEKKIEEKIGKKYTHANLQRLVRKTSVSELKKAYLDETFTENLFKNSEREEIIPRFARENSEREISGAERGSAFHKIMELIDFGTADVKKSIEEMVEKGLISKESAQLVSVSKIEDFLKTDLAKRMGKAQKEGSLKKEQPFVLGIDASRVKPDYPEGETVLLQGIIDAFFVEDGQIVLVDYKTDVIKTASELMERYRIQLMYYEEALTRIVGLPVKESILYSFCLGEEVTKNKS